MTNDSNTDFFTILQESNSNNLVKPLLKWAGGKSKILGIILKKIHSKRTDTNCFFDPFTGSGCVALNSGFSNIVMGDKNKRLIVFHETIRKSPEKVFTKIISLQKEFNTSACKKTKYLELRNKFNEIYMYGRSEITISALFWLLNKTGFNGMYRESSDGSYNIPFGNRDCPSPNFESFMEVSKALQVANIKYADFSETVSSAKEGDVVYFDPPYIPLSRTSSFSSYLKNGFGKDNHVSLSNLMMELHKKNVFVCMSNSNSETTNHIYSSLKGEGFEFEELQVQRTISATNKGRSKANELLVSNF